MFKSKIEQLLSESLPERYAKPLLQQIKPAIRLLTSPAEPDNLPSGHSKIGGSPDMPPDLAWPMSDVDKGQPLHFMAQLRMEDIRDFDTEKQLPPTGLLYFFGRYDEGWTYFLENPDQKSLSRRNPPEKLQGKWHQNWLLGWLHFRREQAIYQACSITPRIEHTFPTAHSPIILKIEEDLHLHDEVEKTLGEAFLEQYYALFGETPQTRRCQLLGYAQGVGNEFFELPGETLTEAMEWTLLLQLDSDERSHMNWGEMGKIYFYIHKADLKAGRFDRVKLISEVF